MSKLSINGQPWIPATEGTEIIEGLLWQCGISQLPSVVTDNKVQVLVSMIPEHEFYPKERRMSHAVETYVNLPLSDGPVLPQKRRLQPVVETVVNSLRAGKRTAVHCAAGWNRSGLVSALALTQFLNISGEEAIELLRQKRSSWVLCNPTFEAHVRKVK